MRQKTILMVDNYKDFLDTRAEYIEQAGYQVLKAYSADDARILIKQFRPDLAVLDVRLINDDDEKDHTGIFLAKTLHKLCPVIMLTDYAAVEVVRQSLKLSEDGKPPAIDFLDKHEGPAELIQAIQRGLQKAGKSPVSPFFTKHFWRIFRVFLFIILCITITVTIFLAQKNDKTALIVGIVFAGLQVLFGVSSWIFTERS